mmetsp:Transcript_27249/g.62804  ORF Transcript_27249/g.62804 Transcript_27249/m.62804 type:complete len:172 (+) Transcript_27249:76-591(+)
MILRGAQVALLLAILAENCAGDTSLLQPLTAQQLRSKWLYRQEVFLIEFHGQWGQKLHNDLQPQMEEVAKQLQGRAIVRTCDVREIKEAVQQFNLDESKMPSLLLLSKGEVIRRWEPVASWVKEGEELEQGRVKEVVAEDIVDWVDEQVEKASKKKKKGKRKSKEEKGEDL